MLLSYKNDPAVKSRLVEHFARHRAMDELIQGETGDNGKGCFVWCCLDRYDHRAFETQLGWPEWLARLADSIFEGLPADEAAQFGTDLIAAVPLGVDLSEVRFRIAVLRNDRLLSLLGPFVEGEPVYRNEVRKAITLVSAWAANPERTETERSAADSAAYSAYSAADSAADWAADSAADSAARSAADSAARSARSAADSARSAADSAARSAADSAWRSERDSLLGVLIALS